MPDDNKLLAKGILLCREGHELLVPVLDPFSLGKGNHTVYYRPFPFCDFIDLANEPNYFRAVKGLENYAEMIRLLTGTKGAIKVYCEVATIEGAQTAVAFSRGRALTYMEQLSDRLIRFVGGSTGV